MPGLREDAGQDLGRSSKPAPAALSAPCGEAVGGGVMLVARGMRESADVRLVLLRVLSAGL